MRTSTGVIAAAMALMLAGLPARAQFTGGSSDAGCPTQQGSDNTTDDTGTAQQCTDQSQSPSEAHSFGVAPQFSGCDDSPENPTLTLAVLAGGALATSAGVRRWRGAKARG